MLLSRDAETSAAVHSKSNDPKQRYSLEEG